MIARPAQVFIDEVEAEATAELSGAHYVVVDVDDVAALDLLGFSASLAGQPSRTMGLVVGMCTAGLPVVLVGNVDPVLRRQIAEVAQVRAMREVGSAALALGYVGTVTEWSDEDVMRKRETWLSLAREAVVESRLDVSTDDRERFPIEELPAACRRMVADGARAQSVDVGLWAVPLVGILAGCIGNSRRALVKVGWSEPCVLDVGLCAESGSGKSVGMRELLRPVRARDRELHEQTTLAMDAYAQELDNWRATPADERGPKPVPPPIRAVVLDDATMEAIALRLRDNPRGLILAMDELAGFFSSFDKYRGGGGDEQRWLSIYDAGSIKVDRAGGGAGGGSRTILVPQAAVSVVGTIQPSVLVQHVGSADRKGSGMAARFLIGEPVAVASRWTDETIAPEVVDDYGRVVRGLLDLSHDPAQPRELRLSKEARQAFIAYHDENAANTHLAATGEDHALAACLSKLRSVAVRAALVLTLARAAEQGLAEVAEVIGEGDMLGGIRIARWFEAEAVRIYARWDSQSAAREAGTERGMLTTLADRLHRFLKERGGRAPMREMHAAMGNNLTADRLRAGLAVLEGGGKARPVKMDVVGRVGRPPEVWEVCP